MEKPAIEGGSPVRDTVISYGRQYIDDDDIAAVVRVLKSDSLTCGPKIPELENKLAAITGARYAVSCSNGTAALHIACLAAGIGPSDEVITTPITFAASANCALYVGAKPVFADINPHTYNIDPDCVEHLITARTKAIVAVDFTGQAVELERLKSICERHHLILIEDAAHAIGTKYNGLSVGSIADMTTFSFHPVKTVTAGEGGAVTTNSPELYRKLADYRAHGITKSADEMVFPSEGPWYYEQTSLGFNYRMTDFQAALLISQLDKLELFRARRKTITEKYNEAFKKIPELTVQEVIPESDTTPHLYILRLNTDMLNCDRAQFFRALCAENIRPQVHYIPVYRHPYYRELGYPAGLCPNAEALYQEILSLPLFYSMTDQDVNDVIAAVQKLISYYKKSRS